MFGSRRKSTNSPERRQFYDRKSKTHRPHHRRDPTLRRAGHRHRRTLYIGSDNGPDTKDPLVNIDTPDVKVEIKTDTSSDKNDPGKAADSSGTEQAIQGTPTKPDAPEKPKAPGQVADDHKAEDVPEADRNKETPPTYDPEQTEVKPQPTEPAGGSTNDAGQVYVPGFGYVTPSGPNDGGTLDDMYENGNKIGIMGG